MRIPTVLAAVLTVAAPAFAQEAQHPAGHHASSPEAAASTSEDPSTQAFKEANAKMHKEMAIDLTGNADIDFVRSMIPHHQGAIDMARILLDYGEDPELRKLAEEIIKAQEAEIAEMRKWLEENGQTE